MNKPASMSDKDYLIRTLAVKLALNEKMIDLVVTHQFQSAYEAMYTNQSVEISGFGKFLFNSNKSDKKMARLLEKQVSIQSVLDDVETTDLEKKRARVVLGKLKDQIKLLKPTIDNDKL
jgi:nucleoid DNA-binding protein